MRPIKLNMQAFGPYKDFSTIDFSIFEEQSLFLLTGDTGSGKTMIFDALTFALFGQTSGNERSASSLRSQFAKSHKETYVELTFIHQNKTYTIRRNPTHTYAKKEGGKETNAMHAVELNMPDGSIHSGVSNVNTLIEILLGLSYDQFKQIALIGQGEFRKLLTAKSDARSEIFRKIFNTKIYQDFEYKLRVMNSEAKKHYDEELLLIQNILDNLEDIEIDNTSIDALDDNMATIEAYIASKKEIEKTLKTQDAKLEAKILSLNKKLEQEKQIQENISRLQKIQEEETTLNNQEKDYQNLETTIKKIKDVKQYITPLSTKLEENKEKTKSIETSIQKHQQEIKTLKTSQESLKQKLTQLNTQKPEIESLKQKQHQLQNTLSKYQALDALEKSIIKTQSELKQTEISLGTSKEMTQKNLAQKKLLEDNLKIQSKLQLEEKDLKTHATSISQLLKLKDNLEKYQDAYQRELKSYELVLQELKENRTQYAKLEERFYLSQAGILASHLVDGEACSVCGSLEHPKPAIVQSTDITKEGLDEKKQALEIIEEKRTKAHGTLSTLKGNLDESQNQYDAQALRYKDQDLQALYDKTQKEYNKVSEDLKKLENTSTALRAVEKILNEEERSQKTLNESFNKLMISSIQFKTELKQLKETLLFDSLELAQESVKVNQKVLNSFDKDLEETQSTLSNTNERQASLNAVITTLAKDLNTHLETYKTLQESFKMALVQYQIDDFDTLMKASSKLEIYEDKLDIYRKKRLENKVLLLELQKSIKDVALPDLEMTQNAIDEAQIESKAIKVQVQENHTQISKQQSFIKRLKNHKKSYQKRLEAYQEINVLYRTASGNLSQKDKISFEYYVQTAYFTKVIEEANKRLDIMTQSRYALKLRTQASDKRTVSGLDLDVIDFHSNQVREVSTLSGGESFKAALSLALGMSDVIQIFAGGIEIDMLFVDEGFGSLDQQSLDQAMQVLTSLSTSNRMIGIISHVSELKQRVEQQIIVNKTVNGSTITQIT